MPRLHLEVNFTWLAPDNPKVLKVSRSHTSRITSALPITTPAQENVLTSHWPPTAIRASAIAKWHPQRAWHCISNARKSKYDSVIYKACCTSIALPATSTASDRQGSFIDFFPARLRQCPNSCSNRSPGNDNRPVFFDIITMVPRHTSAPRV